MPAVPYALAITPPANEGSEEPLGHNLEGHLRLRPLQWFQDKMNVLIKWLSVRDINKTLRNVIYKETRYRDL